MEDFERTVEDFHKDANQKFSLEYEVKKKKKAILIYTIFVRRNSIIK